MTHRWCLRHMPTLIAFAFVGLAIGGLAFAQALPDGGADGASLWFELSAFGLGGVALWVVRSVVLAVLEALLKHGVTIRHVHRLEHYEREVLSQVGGWGAAPPPDTDPGETTDPGVR